MINSPWLPILSALILVFGGLATLEFIFPVWASPFLYFVQKFGVLFGATFGILGAFFTARLLKREEQKSLRHKIARGLSNNFLYAADTLIASGDQLAASCGYDKDPIRKIQIDPKIFELPRAKDPHFQQIIIDTFFIFEDNDFIFLWKNESIMFDGDSFKKISESFHFLSLLTVNHRGKIKYAIENDTLDFNSLIKLREKCLITLYKAANILRENYASDAAPASDELKLIVEAIDTEKNTN